MDLISDLRIALTIARTNSISAASRDLNMTVSTVSRRLDDLEDKLSMRLFNRTTKGLFLTSDGDAALLEAEELVEKADRLIARGASDPGRLSGVLRVTAPARFGQLYIAPVVARFMLDHPGLRVDLACTDQIQNLEETGFDVAIRIGRSGQDHNLVRKLIANRRILVASPNWLARNDLPSSIEELSGCEGLMLGGETAWITRGPEGKRVEIKPAVRFRSQYGDVIHDVCVAGCGVAFKSIWDVAASVKTGRLIHIFKDYEQFEPSDITLVLPRRRFVSERVRQFTEAVEAGLKDTSW